MSKIIQKLFNRLNPQKRAPADPYSSNEEFLEDVYNKILGRGVDEIGKAHYLSHLEKGNSRISVVLDIIKSEEFINKVVRENLPLPPIKKERPANYELSFDIHKKEEVWIFKVKDMADFDWLESRTIESGYYEKPGVWSLQISEDKRLMAEIAAVFQPQIVLDIGCANGPIMKCLKDLGIDSEGIDISRLAVAKAFPEIEEKIHLGDILDVELNRTYDVILGLDIFEHLNPNKLNDYISRINDLLEDSGYLYCNIPAFGPDPLFGEIFRVYLKEWEKDLLQKRCFRTIHVDNHGFPENGHIIGADSEWWVLQFESFGLKREKEIEKALHRTYDCAIERIHIARKAFYVFSKRADQEKNQRIIQSLGTENPARRE